MSSPQNVEPDAPSCPDAGSSRSMPCAAVFDSAHPQDIRACLVGDVMKDMCSVMAHVDIGGAWWATEDAYQTLSAPVQQLDSFLSHTWSAPRWIKFLQLALTFNLNIALGVSLCVAFAFSTCTYLDVAPVLTYSTTLKPKGVAGYLAGSVTYYLLFLFAGDIIGRLGLKKYSSKVFLDKLCINQRDAEKKRQGITALAAAIKRSRSMTILHYRGYIKRLWTNFELACYVTVHGAKRLRWVPALLPVLVLSSSFLFVCVAMLNIMTARNITGLNNPMVGFVIQAFVNLAIVGVTFGLLRQWSAAVEAIDSELRVFDIRAAQCTEEADRETVTDLVALFEGVVDCAETTRSKEMALDSFNERVRQDVRKAFLQSLGRYGIRYKYLCACTWTNVLWMPDRIAGMVSERFPWQDILIMMCINLLMPLCIVPLGFSVLSWLSYRRRCSRRCKYGNILYGAGCSLVAFAFSFMLVMLLSWLSPSNAPGSSYVPFIVVAAVIVVATVIAYRPH